MKLFGWLRKKNIRKSRSLEDNSTEQQWADYAKLWEALKNAERPS